MSLTAQSATGFDYDVFISHHAVDEVWVTEGLLPRLHEADLKVIGEWVFLLGTDRLRAREEAIQKSRHTLVILTPEWCSDNVTSSDGQLAAHLDPAARERRLLPLLLRECQLPLRLEQLVRVDFTDPTAERQEVALTKLLRGLQRPPEVIDKVLARKASSGLTALTELMRAPQVQKLIPRVQQSLQDTRNDLKDLSRWKKLHDRLHAVNVQLPELNRQKNALVKAEEEARGATDAELDDKWDTIECLIRVDVNTTLRALINSTREAGFLASHIGWVRTVEVAADRLMEAGPSHDIKLLTVQGHAVLAKHIPDQMQKVNRDLFTIAGRLKLDELVQELKGIAETLAPLVGSDDVKARAHVHQFSQGIPPLEKLNSRLRTLVNNHDCLQWMEGALPTPAAPPTAVEDFEGYWLGLQEPLDRLDAGHGSDWVLELRQMKSEVERALDACRQANGDPKALRTLRKEFNLFCAKVITCFLPLDTALDRFFDELREVGESLDETLREMPHA